MGKNRFVSPETVRIDLSEGDWIEVRRRLSYGAQQAILSAGQPRWMSSDLSDSGSATTLDFERFKVARICAWVVDWSFETLDGKRLPVTPENVRNLDSESGAELDAALDLHIAASEDEAKKAQPSRPASTARSR